MTTDEQTEGKVPAFKLAQLRYRRRGDAPEYSGDLAELIDFCNNDNIGDDRIVPLLLPESRERSMEFYTGPMFGLQSFPGLLYAPQALSSSIQTELAFRAVAEFCEPPHATNIDLVAPKANEENNIYESMWTLWKQQHHFGESETIESAECGKTKQATKKHRCFEKLSWATMGYQYDWTSRAYHEGCKSEMPMILQSITELFARSSQLLNGSSNLSFTASASIVNYYNVKSIMGGHRDDLEEALDKPIVSISLGCPGIFLLGGKTKDEIPVVPILVRPGDVMVLGGDCRLAFHGMARVIPASVAIPQISERWTSQQKHQVGRNNCSLNDPSRLSEMSDLDRQALACFLSLHRININVRQVY